VPAAPDYPSAPDLVAPKRALLSVSDKTGLVEAAQVLHAAGVELVSTAAPRRRSPRPACRSRTSRT